MLRPGLSLTIVLTGMVAWLAPAPAADNPKADDTPLELKFVKGLRERGYYDLALDYLEQLRKAPDAPADLKVEAEYEMGRSLLEQAGKTADLELRRKQLEQARVKLDAFSKANPNHRLAPEALVQLARLLVERGHLAVLQGDEAKTPAEKQAKLEEARASFGQARASYTQAEKPLRAGFAAYDRFIPEGETDKRDARERAHVALMESELQRALVDYEEAQTYPPGSKERNDLLDKGVASFKQVYQEHRTQLAGLYARMWQGKCYEEKGDLGPAMGIYNELMEHSDPRLRPLQRQVGHFRIIVIGKRKEYALAADEAARWLQANPNAKHTSEGLGVELELAKNILAQVDGLKGSDREAAVRRATDALSEVVHYYSPHKPEALALLQKYRPKAAAGATVPANLSYDDAMAQAESALSGQEWDRAIALFKAAIRRADPAKDAEKANRARYNLAFAYFQSKRYYEADVLVEHLARRYPQWGLSAKSTEMGMASLVMAYNVYNLRDRKADLDRLIALSEYTAATWPETDQGDAARMQLGDIFLGQGKYAEAAQILEAVRTGSSRHPDAQMKAGTAHWKRSLVLRDQGKKSEADSEVKSAEDLLKSALKARQDSSTPPTDPALIGNSCDLADIYLATDRAKDALTLLVPIGKAVGTTPPSADSAASVTRLLATLLRTHIAVGQVDLALNVMKQLEAIGGPGDTLTQLYYKLGQLLQKEMDALQAKGDQAGFRRTQEAYQKFLEALVDSKAGQSYDSLQWAGEAMLSLGEGKQAGEVFQRVLETYTKDQDFQKGPQAASRLLRTRLRLVSALRIQKDFSRAQEQLTPLIEQNKGTLDPLMEKGFLLEAQAEAGKGKWSDAYEHWKRLAERLRGAASKPREYYEASYHVAYALFKEGQKAEAKRALKGVMRMSPKVGGPEMKAKYETLLKQVES